MAVVRAKKGAGIVGGFGRRHKFKAKRTECDAGHKHPSKKEAKRCGELRLLEKAGAVSELEFQPRYALIVNGVKVCGYIADFRYIEKDKSVVEDCKGFKTPEYKLKKKLMAACHGIGILET